MKPVSGARPHNQIREGTSNINVQDSPIASTSFASGRVAAAVDNTAASTHATRGNRRPRKRIRVKRNLGEDEYILTPWFDTIRKRDASANRDESMERRLHDEIVAYAAYIQPTRQENALRKDVCARIEHILSYRFPDGKVLVFGSMAQDLALMNGDIDLCVRTATVSSPESKKRALFTMSSMLRSARIADSVRVNHHARVPIISLRTIPELGSIKIDLGINNEDGLLVVDIIKGYLLQMPALKPLVLVCKGLLSQKRLNDASIGGLNSYSIICMAISFLQLNPGQRPKEFLDRPLQTHSLGYLLLDFLTYYATDFPYTTSYICVAEGKLLSKSSARWINTNHLDRLAIQCLVSPENDVGKSAGRINNIRAVFSEAHAALLACTTPSPAQHESILGKVVRLTQMTVDRRTQLRRLQEPRPFPSRSSPARPIYRQ